MAAVTSDGAPGERSGSGGSGVSGKPVALPHTRVGEGAHHVIAVHGWLCDRTSYDGIIGDLDEQTFSYAVPDLRGYGEARSTPGACTTSEAAGDILALADSLGWDRFSLVGHSMGGAIIQRVLVAAPERVRRMVGLAPVPASGVPLRDDRWELFAGAGERPENRREIIDDTTGGRCPAAWLVRMVRASTQRCDPAAVRAWLDSWALEDFRDQVRGFQVPVRVVVGSEDPSLTAEVMRATWLQWYEAAELVEMNGAGHYLMDETPLGAVRAAEDFLRADGGE
ncbi:alpha/beta fold hydrolase [Streptomyces iconiensis]|uniref:Alpha/beta hydrolase n=1 Tax=Streptomyces iconiensis TaxID=1384038 RepID=A0ABT7A522_9ACTN|nr:alpha/beta hydrolase [Streptomyces iconiensis]MDJ1136416.1 alpha/beta hydrolase [Streptomyces iconiensis]